jgi:hypothetical protein
MDIDKLIAELREEHAQLQKAIVSLERLAGRHGSRRGRPPSPLKAMRNSDLKNSQEEDAQEQPSEPERVHLSEGAPISNYEP